jgi:arginase family enzyme
MSGVRLVELRCRTSDRTSGARRGAATLAQTLGERLGVEARVIGSDEEPRTQDFSDDLRESRGCLLEAGGQVEDALTAGALPVLLASDCSISLTTLPTVARMRPDAKVLWLDAHGDFNSPDTTPSGFLGGMCLAGGCGVWDTGFEGGFPADRVVLCGVRDLDEGERKLVDASGATDIGPQVETLVYLQNALDGDPVYVHLDVDVLDPSIMPAQFPAPGGLTDERLRDLIEAVADASEVVGIEITAFEAPDDDADRERIAEMIADAVDPVFSTREAPDGD